MNNTQLYLTIGVPTFMVLLAWLSNRADMNRIADRLEGKIDKLAESLRNEMTNLRRVIHSDMVPLHERMAVIEAKQE
jgi:hypothetical protein